MRGYDCRRLAVAIMLMATAACANRSPDGGGAEDVRFTVRQPDAQRVHFCSSLDGFVHHPARKDAKGLWTYSMVVDREMSYFFLADGRVVLPDCMMTVADDFGAKNCMYVPGM